MGSQESRPVSTGAEAERKTEDEAVDPRAATAEDDDEPDEW